MKKDLIQKQKFLLKMFYMMQKTRVLMNKSERQEIWNLITLDNTCLSFSSIEKTVPAMAHQIKKHYNGSKLIQSAVFSECVYSQTLANMLGLAYIDNFPENKITEIKNLLQESNIDIHFRYIYSNLDFSKVLIQAGGCNGIDCVLVISKNVYTIEFKEQFAKTSEHDLPAYNENGLLLVTDDFKMNNPQFIPMLEEQKELNFFEVMGSNINNFSASSISFAVDNNYSEDKSCKYAEVIVTEDKNSNLIMLPTQDISKWADVCGEIRPAGRNPHKVWTPNALTRFILSNGGTITDNIVKIPANKLILSNKRGSRNTISRYKINPLFFVRVEDCFIVNGIASFNYSKIRQLRPTIAAKMSFRATYSQLKDAYSSY